jgi:hypothetical protein
VAPDPDVGHLDPGWKKNPVPGFEINIPIPGYATLMAMHGYSWQKLSEMIFILLYFLNYADPNLWQNYQKIKFVKRLNKMPGARSIQAGETAEVHQFSPYTKFQPILY